MVHSPLCRSWQVLVLFGASGTGKSTIASQIAREQGISWIQVDDLRLALQYSRATLPEHNDELYYFLNTRDVWTRHVDEIRDGFVGTARAMVPAVRIVIDSHVVTGAPMVLEGDGVWPEIAEDPVIAPWVDAGAGVVRFCCIAADSQDQLVASTIGRGRGDHLGDLDRVAQQANANWSFNHWLVAESLRLGIPVAPCQPFDTLANRILQAVSGDQHPTR